MTARCNCRSKPGRPPDSLKDALCRALEESDDPCPVHDADELTRREAEAEADRYRDALEVTAAEVQQTDDLAARRKERDQRNAALSTLAQTDPMLAELVHRTGAAIPDMPLNATAIELAPVLGMTPANNNHDPLDAA